MNCTHIQLNHQHDRAHLDAQILRSQALAEMWAGMGQQLTALHRPRGQQLAARWTGRARVGGAQHSS